MGAYKMPGRAVFIFIVGVTLILSRYLSDPTQFYVSEIKKGYTGVITDKYIKKFPHLTIKTSNNETLDVAPASMDLYANSSVGDSIEKIPDDDYIILNKSGKKMKLLFFYIPNDTRADRRWPKEWKDKWLPDN
jgi:hypothetical protein